MRRLAAQDPSTSAEAIVEGGCTSPPNDPSQDLRMRDASPGLRTRRRRRLAARARLRFGRQSMLFRIARWFGSSERHRRLTRGFSGPRPRTR